MASNAEFFLLSYLLFITTPSLAKTSTSKPKAIVFETTKDESTKLHLTTIHQKNPLAEIKVFFDVGAQDLWLDCENSYNSSSYKHIHLNSTECTLAEPTPCNNKGCQKSKLPRCIPDPCFSIPTNPLIDTVYCGGLVSEDELLFQSYPGKLVTVPKYIFTCVPSVLAQRLPGGAAGIAGFGRTNISLPVQLAKTFNLPTTFGVCLSSSTKSKGVIVLGDTNIGVTSNLIFTPLIVNSNGFSSIHSIAKSEYHIKIRSIKVNNKKMKFSGKLLSVNGGGDGGTTINTYSPYTLMEPPIYKVVSDAFVTELSSVTNRVQAVAPFGVCFNASGIARTRVGPAVPTIDFVLEKNAVWRIYGSNSMVQIKKNVMCLGIIEKLAANFTIRASIDIGTHQLEDNLLVFDLDRSRVGFSSSLLFRNTTCANFNSYV